MDRPTKLLATGIALLALLIAACAPPTAEEAGVDAETDDDADAPADPAPDDDTDPDTDDTDDTEEASAPGDVLVAARTGDVDNLDPHMATAFQTVQTLGQIYETLFESDSELQIVPGLAEDHVFADDGMSLELTIAEGVTFHDGSDLSADDVVASLERVLDEDSGAVGGANLASVESIEAPDDTTVVLGLSKQDATLPAALANLNTAIAPAEHIESGDISTEPVGTGAFVYDDWTQGDVFRTTAFDDYRLGAPAIDGVEFRVVPDEPSVVAGLQADQYDFGVLTDPLVVADIDEGALEVERAPSLSYRVLQLNTEVEPLDDEAVRQAIACTVDRDEVIASALLGEGEVTGPFTSPAYDLDPYLGLPCDGPDPDLGQELLDGAGHGDGFSLETIVMTGGYATAVNEAQSVQAQLSAIGIDLELETLETNVYVDRWMEADYDVAVALNGGNSDPHLMYNRYFTSDGNFQSVATHATDELDELFVAGEGETDEDARTEIYTEIAEHLGEASPWVWMAQGFEYWVHQPEVSGFVGHPTGSLRGLRDVSLDS